MYKQNIGRTAQKPGGTFKLPCVP